MRKQQLVKWFKEHEQEFIGAGIALVGFGVGYYISGKAFDWRISYSLTRLTNDGILKFFDPTTGLEVGVDEACKIAIQKYKV